MWNIIAALVALAVAVGVSTAFKRPWVVAIAIIVPTAILSGVFYVAWWLTWRAAPGDKFPSLPGDPGAPIFIGVTALTMILSVLAVVNLEIIPKRRASYEEAAERAKEGALNYARQFTRQEVALLNRALQRYRAETGKQYNADTDTLEDLQ